MLRFMFFFRHYHATYRQGKRVILEGVLLDQPTFRKGFLFMKVAGVEIVSHSDLDLHYGDKVKIKGLIEQSYLMNKKNGRFNIFGKNRYILKTEKIEKVGKPFPLLTVSVFIRHKLSQVFHSVLPPRQAGLLLGIVLGAREGIDREFSKRLADTGVLHVVAASGMNVSMFGGFLYSMLLLFLKRNLAIVLSGLGLIFYAVLAGLDASIVRATLMALLSYTAWYMGRQYMAYFSLYLAGVVILLVSPLSLFDVGFQLSFLSTLGILVAKPVLDAFFIAKLGRRIGVFDDISTTIGAQLASLPILISTFSSYAPVSVLANALLLWTIPYLMIFGGLAALLGLISSFLASPVLYLSYPLLLLFEKLVFLLSSIWKPWSLPPIPMLFWIGYYLVLLSLAIWQGRRKMSI